jgi:hypothetical protein
VLIALDVPEAEATVEAFGRPIDGIDCHEPRRGALPGGSGVSDGVDHNVTTVALTLAAGIHGQPGEEDHPNLVAGQILAQAVWEGRL